MITNWLKKKLSRETRRAKRRLETRCMTFQQLETREVLAAIVLPITADLGELATPASLTTTLGDTAAGAKEVELYKVSLKPGSVLTAATSRAGAASAATDTYLRLFDASGNQVAFDDDSGGFPFSKLQYSATAGGVYYLGVSGYGNSTYNLVTGAGLAAGRTGDFKLNISVAGSSPLPITADWRALNGTYQTTAAIGDTSAGAREVDLYQVDLKAGAAIAVTTSRPAETPSTTPNLDTYVRIFDSTGNQVAYDDDSAGNLYSKLTFTARQSGSYYVGVSEYRNRTYQPLSGVSLVDGRTGPYALSVTVTGNNNAPTANTDMYRISEDGLLSIGAAQGVLANDHDPDHQSLAAQLVTAPSHGQLALAGDGSFQYTPLPDYFGTDTFAYAVSDGIAQSSATVTIDVAAINDAPRVGPRAFTVAEDEMLSVAAADGLLAGTSNPDGDLVTTVIDLPPQHGRLVAQPDGSFQYQPAADFHGIDTFRFHATDGQAVSDVMTATVQVLPVNDAPVAPSVIAFEFTPGTPLALSAEQGLLSEAFDIEADALQVELMMPPSAGTLDMNPDGSFQYVAANGTVQDQFTYRIRDGQSASDPITVALQAVAGTARPPAMDVSETTDAPTPNEEPGEVELRTRPGTVSLDAATGTLTIVGTGGDDWSDIYSLTEGEIMVDLESVQATGASDAITTVLTAIFPSNEVRQIVFYGGPGFDVFNNSVDVPSLAYGGAGSDDLDGGRQADVLDGGPGADRLTGGEGDDTLIGGSGIDEIEAGFGSEGIDRIEFDHLDRMGFNGREPLRVYPEAMLPGDVWDLVELPQHGRLDQIVVPGGGSESGISSHLQYFPGPGFVGSDAFSYRVRRGDELVVVPVTIHVHGPNQVPEFRSRLADFVGLPSSQTTLRVPLDVIDPDGDEFRVSANVYRDVHPTNPASVRMEGNDLVIERLNPLASFQVYVFVTDDRGGQVMESFTISGTYRDDAYEVSDETENRLGVEATTSLLEETGDFSPFADRSGANWAADLALLDRQDLFSFRFNGGPDSRLSLTSDPQFAALQFELHTNGQVIGPFSGSVSLFDVLPDTRFGQNSSLGLKVRVFAPDGGLNPRYRLEYVEATLPQVTVERRGDHDLLITGTDFDDFVEVKESGDQIIVNTVSRVNGVPTPFAATRYPKSEIGWIRFSGRAGSDQIVNATAIDSILSGGDGNDSLYGGSAADELLGDAGDDLLAGWYGSDTYTFRGDNLGEDRLLEPEGSTARDTLKFSDFDSGVRLNLSQSENRVAAGLKLHLGTIDSNQVQTFTAPAAAAYENVIGSLFNDEIIGNNRPNRLEGREGNDVLLGEGGDDRLFGDAGNDFLDGGPGTNYVSGGAGLDQINELDPVRRVEDLLDSNAQNQVKTQLVELGRSIEQIVRDALDNGQRQKIQEKLTEDLNRQFNGAELTEFRLEPRLVDDQTVLLELTATVRKHVEIDLGIGTDSGDLYFAIQASVSLRANSFSDLHSNMSLDLQVNIENGTAFFAGSRGFAPLTNVFVVAPIGFYLNAATAYASFVGLTFAEILQGASAHATVSYAAERRELTAAITIDVLGNEQQDRRTLSVSLPTEADFGPELRNRENFSGDPVYYINGMLTSSREARDEAEELSKQLRRPVLLIYNGTAGLGDLTEVLQDHGWDGDAVQHNPTTIRVAQLLKQAAQEGKRLSFVTHSQGNMILRNALRSLGTDQRAWSIDSIAWVLTGSPVNPEGVVHSSLIPNADDPINAARGIFDEYPSYANHYFIENYLPQIRSDMVF